MNTQAALNKGNPYKKGEAAAPAAPAVVEPVTYDQPCLIPFVLWQERDVSDITPTQANNAKEEVEIIKSKAKKLKNKLMDTTPETECMSEDGIYTNETCHHYEVLKRLCVQIGFEQDDSGKVQSAYYEKGCFSGGDS